MEIYVNGEIKKLEKQTSLSNLLKLFSLPDQRIAVELNKQVVRRKDWENIQIKDADKIEIVHFVGGG